ncbi:MAG: alkaline phosphatase family protein [Bacillaceae bacterium]|nr:alkaline phosphatase family protein [Bacillaceae bacterium]
MKKASWFEIIAARAWNLLNEGKPFTPIFVTGTFLFYHIGNWTEPGFWAAAALGLVAVLPLLAIYYHYDFPLMLRNYLWAPLVVYLLIGWEMELKLVALSLALYFFFTVFFWGTLYYHLRIGTTWWNFTRFWKLVLKNSDSTSGNAQEQIPKFLLILALWQAQFLALQNGTPFTGLDWFWLIGFQVAVGLYSYILHRYLFDWKPEEIRGHVHRPEPPANPLSEKVVVIVVDGMRKDRFQQANTPFLHKMCQNGTEYTQMETVYPARTVVCFSSMFTGAYPREHGITSNMVWKLGVRTETIFDSLRKVGKKGRLLGIAHLIDAMGDDVESVTAVMHNDVADQNIMKRARLIMNEQDPDLLVVQLIATDQTGHSRGVFYPEYIEKIEQADRLIEDFVDWIHDRGIGDKTTFIVCADHGQADGIGGHGHLDEGERYVPFFMFGNAVQPGKKVEQKHSLISLAPTLAYLLGAPYPAGSRGPVLTEAIQHRKEGNQA